MEEVINETINDTTFTEVKLNIDQVCWAYSMKMRGGASFLAKKSLLSTAYWTVDADGALSITEFIGDKGGTLFVAKLADAGDDAVIEVVITRNE
jgi:hypothetical protein